MFAIAQHATSTMLNPSDVHSLAHQGASAIITLDEIQRVMQLEN
jgi:hypothetical protein